MLERRHGEVRVEDRHLVAQEHVPVARIDPALRARDLAEASAAHEGVQDYLVEIYRTKPDVAQMFALPAELHEEGVLRYGFH